MLSGRTGQQLWSVTLPGVADEEVTKRAEPSQAPALITIQGRSVQSTLPPAASISIPAKRSSCSGFCAMGQENMQSRCLRKVIILGLCSNATKWRQQPPRFCFIALV